MNCKGCMTKLFCWYGCISCGIERYLAPVVDLIIRICMFEVFFKSGWLKLGNAFHGNWGLTVYLFQEEHPVPLLPAEYAAVIGTASELIFASLLLIGLGGRLSAFVLLIMTAVIEFTYQQSIHHVLWAFLLAVIFVHGPGRLSVDYWIHRKMKLGCSAEPTKKTAKKKK